MPVRIGHKPCISCGKPVKGVRRKTRKAFRYPQRCKACMRKSKWTPEGLEVRRGKLRAWRAAQPVLPLGSKRQHRPGRGLTYTIVKTAQPNTWNYEHRLVMEQTLGRKLERLEHVHHINGDTLDNRPENLAVLSSADHTREHLALNGRWSARHSRCVICASTERKHLALGQCTACYQRTRHTRSRGA